MGRKFSDRLTLPPGVVIRNENKSFKKYKLKTMKKRIILPLILTIGLVVLFMTACKKDNASKTYSVSGKVQKGPFVSGANITINELNSDLEQTGKSFSTTIGNDDGNFTLNSVELGSEIALLTVNGYYFDEVNNNTSTGTLNLQAYANISGKNIVNINVMTHVIKERVEKLYATGLTFEQANAQAKEELLQCLFGISASGVNDFDQMDISLSGDDNAILLAFSVMMLRYNYTTPAILTEFLTKLRSDFGEDGDINDVQLIEKIYDNVRYLNIIKTRHNLENKYQSLGVNSDLPDYEKYINKFTEKYSDTLYADFYYPEFASNAQYNDNPNLNINALYLANTNFSNPNPGLTFAVITPLNRTLTVKFKPVPGYPFNLSSLCYMDLISLEQGGWYLEKQAADEVIIKSARQNVLISYYFCRWVPSGGQMIIEYYEDDVTTPTFTKTVNF